MFIGQIICIIVLMAVYTAKSSVVASNVTICTAIPNTRPVIARIDRKIVWIIVTEISWCPRIGGMAVATAHHRGVVPDRVAILVGAQIREQAGLVDGLTRGDTGVRIAGVEQWAIERRGRRADRYAAAERDPDQRRSDDQHAERADLGLGPKHAGR